jgi:hypothetical protein
VQQAIQVKYRAVSPLAYGKSVTATGIVGDEDDCEVGRGGDGSGCLTTAARPSN